MIKTNTHKTRGTEMERTRAWFERVTKEGFGDVVAEGRNWAEVRFWHHRTGVKVHSAVVIFTD